jgi:hypothetical protein
MTIPFEFEFTNTFFNCQPSQVAPTFTALLYCDAQKIEYESDAKTFGQMYTQQLEIHFECLILNTKLSTS